MLGTTAVARPFEIWSTRFFKCSQISNGWISNIHCIFEKMNYFNPRYNKFLFLFFFYILVFCSKVFILFCVTLFQRF